MPIPFTPGGSVPEGMKVIFRPFITLKDGRKIWARQYGKRAFALLVPA